LTAGVIFEYGVYMENNSVTTQNKAWTFCGVSTVGMIVFAALYFNKPPPPIQSKPTTITSIVTNTVTNTVTQEVVKEVPKEVEKIVTVPAQISSDDQKLINLGAKLMDAVTNSPIKDDQVLFGMKDVNVFYIIGDKIKEFVTEDEIKAKFELTLRRNNVPINPKSFNTVVFSVAGFSDDATKTLISYSTKCYVTEYQTIFRQGVCHQSLITVWEKGGFYGYAGKNKINDVMLDNAEKDAEMFANDFLSANPK